MKIMLGKILEPDQRVKKLFAVTDRQVRDVAKKVINTRQLNLALIGPIEDRETIEKLIEDI